MSRRTPPGDGGAGGPSDISENGSATAPKPQPENVPAELRGGGWCIVRWPDKSPRSPRTRRRISTTTRRGWATFNVACAALKPGDALGRRLDPGDDVIVIDLDRVRDPASGELTDEARAILDRFPNCFTEMSPSGRGLHVWTCSSEAQDVNTPRVQVFTGESSRFCTLTGDTLPDRDQLTSAAPEAIRWLMQTYPPSADSDDGDDEMPALLDQWELDDLPELDPEDQATLDGNFPAGADRSRLVSRVAHRLAAAGLGAAQLLSRLWWSDGPRDVALDHRRRDDDRALAYLWRHHARPAVRGAVDATEGFDEVQDQQDQDDDDDTSTDPLSWTRRFKMSKTEADKLASPSYVEDGLIVQGHVIAVAGAPNSGKTTIFFDLAGRWAAVGYHVLYVNADTSAADAKQMVYAAEREGFDLLLPDMKVGQSMANVVAQLERMVQREGDFSGTVMIFDTLKKMTDVISKQMSKELYRTLRALSARGMTIILLCHTNKYLGADGKPIYEGTGDLRSDVDELIYLIPQKHGDGSLTVSAEPDKVRAVIRPTTFEISSERDVRIADDFVDVAAQIQARVQREKDEPVIETITEAIQCGRTKQSEITTHCKEYGNGRRTVLGVLRRYTGKLWHAEKILAHNATTYELLSDREGGGVNK
ncbi:MAG: AAA family ATPase [Pseudomonadota bacterium]